MAINIHQSQGIISDDLFNFMVSVEGNIDRVYTDAKGIPTMGVGYAIFELDAFGNYNYRSNYVAELSGVGITLNSQDIATLNSVLSILNNNDKRHKDTHH